MMRAAIRAGATAAALLATAPVAQAQGCIGAAVPDGARAVVASVGHVSYPREVDGLELGLGYRDNLRGPLAYSAGYAFRTLGESNVRMHVLAADIAFRLPRFGIPLLTLCPRTGVMGARVSSGGSSTNYTNLTIPLALVVELPLPVAGGATLVPYAAPQLLWSRTTGEVLGIDFDANESGLGIEAGAALRVRRVVVTGGFITSDLPATLGTPAVPEMGVFLHAGFLF